MHSDPAEVRKTISKYMMNGGALLVSTVIVVPLAITVALIIASVKGSLVAAVFMHLSDEKKWIYGSLILTVVFFFVLMMLPILTTSDHIGTPIHAPAAAEAEHAGH